MIFTAINPEGTFIVQAEKIEDERGFFARSFCKKEFEEQGLDATIAQCSVAMNKKRGTIRGLHYQAPPCEETKVVSCLRGSLYDVVLDLRRNSRTYLQWAAEELHGDDYKMIFVPKGCAHGYQTLGDHTLVSYQMSEFYSPDSYRGVRWNDPAFGIEWPLPDAAIISKKDSSYQDFIK
jgi:dTDP-4-dehydrorhamnose 3,5-epimerase